MTSHDPKLERLVREGLKSSAVQDEQPPQLTQAEVWGRCGNCPQCGAPIWAMLAVAASATPPRATYTCHCALLVSRKATLELQSWERAHAPPAEKVNGAS